MEGTGGGQRQEQGQRRIQGLSTSPSTRAARSGFGRDDGVDMWCDGEGDASMTANAGGDDGEK